MLESRGNVSIILTLLLAFLCAVVLLACDTQTSTGDDTACVHLDLLHGETKQPSVVKLYFHVKTCDGKPMAGVPSEQFVIKEDGSEVSAFESDQGFVPDPHTFMLATVLLLDMSGSILESGNLAPLQQAAKAFVDTVSQGQTVAIYTFDGRPDMQLLHDFSDSAADLNAAIDSLSSYSVVDKSTNLNGAVLQGLKILEDREGMLDEDQLFAGSLAVFTDGTDQAAYKSDNDAARASSNSSFSVYSIGLGGEVDGLHLEAIGKDGSYIANDVDSLVAVFTSAAADIGNMAKSYYILAYCSPKRAGYHSLELSIRGATGSTTYDFDADGFIGGCSLEDFMEAATCDFDLNSFPDLGRIGGDPCTSDDQCLSGMMCLTTEMLALSGIEGTVVDGMCTFLGCSEDSQCGEGGVCFLMNESGSMLVSICSSPCEKDADCRCGVDYRCIAGTDPTGGGFTVKACMPLVSGES